MTVKPRSDCGSSRGGCSFERKVNDANRNWNQVTGSFIFLLSFKLFVVDLVVAAPVAVRLPQFTTTLGLTLLESPTTGQTLLAVWLCNNMNIFFVTAVPNFNKVCCSYLKIHIYIYIPMRIIRVFLRIWVRKSSNCKMFQNLHLNSVLHDWVVAMKTNPTSHVIVWWTAVASHDSGVVRSAHNIMINPLWVISFS